VQGDKIVTNKTNVKNPSYSNTGYTNPAPGVNTPRWDRADYFANRTAVAALFTNVADGERAINALKAAGIMPDHIGIAMRERNAQGVIVEETGTHATKGDVKGAVGGGLLGGLAGFLVGIGALVLPGIGPVISAGVLTAALGTIGATTATGAVVGGAVGGVAGALVGLGIPREEAKYFEEGFRKGGMLVTVNAPNRAAEVAQILERYSGDLAASAFPTPRTTSTMS
jgi:hypothetical protein